MIKTLKSFDKHKSILLIGSCKTNKYLYDIVQPESKAEALDIFGDCLLVDSYNALYDIGLSNIYIYNTEIQHDILQVAEEVCQYDFAYIVPVDVYMSDYFYDPNNNGKKTYYLQYLLNSFYQKNNSKIIATDKHASLYQDIDSFLNDMQSINENFKNRSSAYGYLDNIVFVANNLDTDINANIYLAGMLAYTDINEYPNYDNLPNAVFYIDTHDNINDMAYFKSHANGTVTIENLLNLCKERCPHKIEFISRIMNYIKRSMEFNEFLGKFFTEYIKKNIEKKAEAYYSSLVGYILTDFSIDNIYAKQGQKAGTVDVYMESTISVINCTEKIKVVTKINDRE